MTLSDGLSWAAEIASALSMWAYGTKTLKGPISGLFSNLIWLWLGIHSGLTGLIAGSLLFMAIHVYNFIKWSKQ